MNSLRSAMAIAFSVIICLVSISTLCIAPIKASSVEPKRSIIKEINPEDVITWEAYRAETYADGAVWVYLRLRSDGPYGIYRKNLAFSAPGLAYVGAHQEAPITQISDPVSGQKVDVFRNGDFVVVFQGLEPYREGEFTTAITYVACTTKICLFPHTVSLALAAVHLDNPSPSLVTAQAESSGAEPVSPPLAAEEESIEERLAVHLKNGKLAVWMLLLILFFGGLLTNLTPCVYPMIPITIRVLAKHGSQPLRGALSYALGIVVTYTGLGILAALTGTLFGQYMASKGVNIFLAIVMFLLGLSMLGGGQWHWLQKVGARFGVSDKMSVQRAFVLGCGAGFIASPCTGPILASLLTFVIAKETTARAILYLFVYSIGFASPYVLLGSFSSVLAHRRVSPAVQVFVKLAFASVMFALTFYYLRIPLYSILPLMREYWDLVSLVSLATAVSLFTLFVASRSNLSKVSVTVVPALAVGVFWFAGSQWLLLGDEQKQRQLVWTHDEGDAIARARSEATMILIDFWAEWCEACKKMDKSTFSDSRVLKQLQSSGWLALKLDVTEMSDLDDSRLSRYGVISLPTLVLFDPVRKKQENIEGYVSAAKLVNAMRVFQGG